MARLVRLRAFARPIVAAVALAATLPSTSFAAGAGAGVDASFTTMLNDLTGMLGGNFGALVLLISLIIAVAVYGITANWRWVISSVMVAFLIGYGIDIIQGIGGVTATVDMLALVETNEQGTIGPQ